MLSMNDFFDRRQALRAGRQWARHVAHLAGKHAAGHGSRRGHGFFGFGGDFGQELPGGIGRGMGGFGPGRKLGSADLQLLLLALLAERESHGYELIKALGERSHGYYTPSPGMVYPALTYLEELGHATVQSEGAKKLYRISATGQAHLESNRVAVDSLLQQLDWIGRKMDHLRQAMSGHLQPGDDEADELDAGERGWSGGHRQFHGMSHEIRLARRELKLALVEKSGAPPEEQQRIAAILQRAAADIRGV